MEHREDLEVSSGWLDDINEDLLEKNTSDAFYCPYTNSAKCALLAKGWQPQELCQALECEQMQLVRHNRNKRRQYRAA